MTTVKVGNTRIKIYHWRSKSGYDQFKVSYQQDGKLKRETLKLTSADRSTYLHALELLKPTSIPLHVAIQEYLSLRKPTECPQKLVPDVVAQLLEDKKTHGASVRHIQTLRR